MATHGLPPISLPPSALRFTVRKWCCCVCRAISGLEAISRSISKASSSALLQMDFGGVNLALGSWNSCVWAVSQQRAMAESWSCIIFLLWWLFFCICISQCITWRHFYFILFDTAADETVGRSLGWLRRGGVGCLHQAPRIMNKTSL